MGVLPAMLAMMIGAPAAPPAEGDTIVAFEVAATAGASRDIQVQRLDRLGKPVWAGGKPLSFASAVDDESSPAICDDDAGGAIVAYEYKFASGEHAGDVDVVAQRIGPDGRALWGSGTRPVQVAGSKSAETHPLIMRDGRGGAIVVWEWRNEKGDSDLLAQRLGPASELTWGKEGKPVVVAASPSPERGACLVSDGQGGVIVCFEWVGEDGDIDVMAQRISADGSPMWNEKDRARDVAASKHLERHVTAAADGRGGVIAVYEVEFTSGEDKADIDVMAQRLSSDGKLLWDAGGCVVSSAKAFERNPAAVSDGEGGVIAAVEVEMRDGENKGDIDVLAQRLGPDGKMLWNNGERSCVVSSSKHQERSPSIIGDGQGGVLVACEMEYVTGDSKGDLDVVAQRLDKTGKMVWNDGNRSRDVATSKWSERRPFILADGQGGGVVLFTQTGTSGEHQGDIDVGAMRISSTGVMDWQDGKSAANVADSSKLEANPCALVVGGWRWVK